MAVNVYQMVTDRILADLEKNIIPWRKPWTGGVPLNYVSRQPYHGVNLLLLPYGGEWLTFLQAKEAGGNIKKGEKSSIVVFFKMLEDKNADNEGEDEKKMIPFLKYSNVFHISQCENIKSKLPPVELNNVNHDTQAENVITDYINRSGVTLKNVMGSNEAYYRPSTDTIVLPDIKQFKSTNEYYSTAYHELAHSTGHKSRLDRISKDASFGSKDYSKEELVAEVATCMLMNFIGLEIPSTFENSIAYIDSWRKKLKEDNKIILQASSQAQKAVNLILNNE